ncbi:MAG: GYD domain-containing protein [Thermoanaerobaculia bacterium]
MPTYISLIQFTQQGISSIKESPKRIDAARKAYEQAGGKLKDFYLVMGEYDIVTISEAPNDEAAAKISLSLGAKGNVRTRTSRAFTEAEYRKIVEGLA